MSHSNVQPPTPSAQTTPTDLSGQLIPEVQPAAPSAQSTPAQPAAPTTSAQPVDQSPQPPMPRNQVAPAATATPRSLHSQIFDGVLKTLTGGQQFTLQTDPETGESKQVPIQRTRGQLGKSVIAGVLAGMFSQNHYMEGPGGAQRIEPSGTVGGAFAAGQAQQAKLPAAAQAQQDEIMTRKMAVVKNNADAMHLYAATTHSLGVDAQQQADNFAPVLKVLADQDSHLGTNDDGTPQEKGILAGGMLMADALKHPELADALTKHSFVPDGVIPVDDGHGHMIPTQTFSIINPNVTVNADKDTIDIMSQINPMWRKGLELSGGSSVKARVGVIQNVTNKVNSVKFAERLFQDYADSKDPLVQALGLKGDIKGEIMSAVQQGKPGARQALDALMHMENSQSQGGDLASSLNRLINDPDARAGSGFILSALGLTREKAQKYITDYTNQQISANKLAQQGGMGENSPQADEQTDRQIDAVKNNPNLTASDRKDILSTVPKPDKDGHYHITRAQGEKLMNGAREITTTNKGIAEKKNLANGDPTTMTNTAHDVIGFGSIDSVTKIASMRGQARENAQHAIEQTAAEHDLTPSHFSTAAMDAKSKAVTDYSAGGKVGQQLNSFGTFGDHVAGAYEANEAWKRSGSPLINKPISWLAENAANDQNYQRFRDSIIAPAKEYMNFLNAGRAEHDPDIKAMENALNSKTATAATIYTALQVFARTADDRAYNLGQTYVGTVHTTFPHIISKSTVDAFARLGVKSRAADVSGELPRSQSWSANLQQQTISNATPEGAQLRDRFMAAAGGDKIIAADMAKEHGWTLTN